MSAIRVRVPASTANLGPGFDVLAAALGRHLEFEVVETGSFGIVTDMNLRRDRENLIVRAFERIAPSRRLRISDQLHDPAQRRLRLERRRSSSPV